METQTELDLKFKCHNCDCSDDADGFEIGGHYYCTDCVDELFSLCDHCSEYFPRNEITVINGEAYCEDCRDYSFFRCDHCGEWVDKDHTNCYGGDILCDYCFGELFTRCDWCEEIFPNNEVEYNNHTNQYICGHCAKENNHGLIRDYGFKPTPIFHGKGFHYGVELEVESCDNSIDDAVEYLHDEVGEFIYMKEDGSLNEGFEIVTHPFTFDWMNENKELFQKILDIRKHGFRSFNTDTCGMHVHISRTAFTTYQLYRWLKFFMENPVFIYKISQRKSRSELSEWATMGMLKGDNIASKAKMKKAACREGVNLCPQNTIEIRIFKGNLCPASFYKNIEFLQALHSFTKDTKTKDINVPMFIKYCEENPKPYKNLIKFINDKNLKPGE